MATNFPNSPSNGDTHAGFTYNSTTTAWESVPSGIGALTDVDTSTSAPSTGQLLQWNGTNWVPFTHATGITEIDVWRLETNQTSDAIPITGTWTRDAINWTKLGTGMSESSGTFSFPSTGMWRIMFHPRFYLNNTDSLTCTIRYSIDNFTNWGTGTEINFSEQLSSATGLYPTTNGEYLFNVTNTSTHKIQFTVAGQDTNNYLYGNNTLNRTFASFIRLSDAV